MRRHVVLDDVEMAVHCVITELGLVARVGEFEAAPLDVEQQATVGGVMMREDFFDFILVRCTSGRSTQLLVGHVAWVERMQSIHMHSECCLLSSCRRVNVSDSVDEFAVWVLFQNEERALPRRNKLARRRGEVNQHVLPNFIAMRGTSRLRIELSQNLVVRGLISVTNALMQNQQMASESERCIRVDIDSGDIYPRSENRGPG